jgi:hypothetical protein
VDRGVSVRNRSDKADVIAVDCTVSSQSGSRSFGPRHTSGKRGWGEPVSRAYRCRTQVAKPDVASRSIGPTLDPTGKRAVG